MVNPGGQSPQGHAHEKSGGGSSGRISRADSAYHDAIAARFDASYDAHPEYASWWANRIENLIWPLYAPRGTRILDVGAGPGRLARAFADHGFNATALDHSPGMVALAENRLAGRGRAILADGDHLPFPGASFDLAILFGMLHHAIGEGDGMAEAIVREASRVARRVVVVEPNILHPYFFATTHLWHGLQARIAGYPRVAHERPFGLHRLIGIMEGARAWPTQAGRIDACQAYGSRLRLPAPFTSHIYAVH